MEINNCHHENFEPASGNVFCPQCGYRVENITIANFTSDEILISEMKCRHRIVIPIYPGREYHPDTKMFLDLFFAHVPIRDQMKIDSACNLAQLIVFVSANHRNRPVGGNVIIHAASREQYWTAEIPFENLSATLPGYDWQMLERVGDPLDILVRGKIGTIRDPFSEPLTMTLTETIKLALEKFAYCYCAERVDNPPTSIGNVLLRMIETYPMFRDPFAVFVPANGSGSPFSFRLLRGHTYHTISLGRQDFISLFSGLDTPDIETKVRNSGGVVQFLHAHEIYINYHLQKRFIKNIDKK